MNEVAVANPVKLMQHDLEHESKPLLSSVQLTLPSDFLPASPTDIQGAVIYSALSESRNELSALILCTDQGDVILVDPIVFTSSGEPYEERVPEYSFITRVQEAEAGRCEFSLTTPAGQSLKVLGKGWSL
jgi:hypothetical protein